MENRFADIVIVGGGMIGATLALALSRLDCRIMLIEGQSLEKLSTIASAQTGMPSVHNYDPRVSALTAASQQLFEGLGVWQNMVTQQVSPYRHMSVWDADGTGHIEFDAADMHQASLGFIVENRVVVSALYEKLLQDRKVDLLFGRRVRSIEPPQADAPGRGGRVLLLDDGAQVSCNLLVGADGAQSQVRNLVSIPTREWDYEHHGIVATVETALPHNATAWQRFMGSGPIAFLPLSDSLGSQRYCSIVWSATPDIADELMACDEDEFCSRLAAALELRLGAVTNVSARYRFPLRQRHAKYYFKEGVVLVGDAAHTIHPLAGQGANLGLLDVAVLADELIRSQRRGVAISDSSILQRYQRRRMGPNLAMMGVMEGFKQLFAKEDLGLRWLRNTGMKWLNRTPFIKNEIVSQAMGLNVRMPRFQDASSESSQFAE
ncbi:MAG: UbiH/UbiF/VisC/COQ6 family ubiquinone biosynthesis hydroxylase [Pseudomonadales bacterium]|nr:UbiH/UbiF/VisC/COQ6 family ubiquinone biosynthesis hydroxylase [Pseudomonadales bacterium]